jgi:hypothetical protein
MKMTVIFLWIHLAMLLGTDTLLAQAPTRLWDKTLGGSNSDVLMAMSPTPDGGYLLAGTSTSADGDHSAPNRGNSDYWIVKINAQGQKQWDKSYGGAEDDQLFALVADSDGGYLLVGTSESGKGGDKTEDNFKYCVPENDPDFPLCFHTKDYWLVKISATGEKQWDKTLGTSENQEVPTSAVQTSDGGYLLSGLPFELVKVSATGEKQWEKHFEGDGYSYLNSVVNTSDGGYLLGGFTGSGIGGDKTQAGCGPHDIWLIKTSATGEKQWDKSIGGCENEYLYSQLLPTPDGGYLIGATSRSGIGGDKTQSNRGDDDYWVVKINDTGTLQWEKTFGGDQNDVLTSVIANASGGYLLSGYSYSGQSGDRTEASRGENDFWLVSIGSSGAKEWDKRFGGNRNDISYSALHRGNGTYAIGGYSSSGISGDKSEDVHGPGDSDFWVIQVTAPTCTATGTILREYWANVKGNQTSDGPVNKAPTSTSYLTSFEAPSNVAENYASRIRGYLCAPETGNYTFWIASDDYGDLYLSTNDDPANKQRIAYIKGWSNPRQYNKHYSQKSAPVYLEKGKRYYIEALHKEAWINDNLAVAWRLPSAPSSSFPAIIPGAVLSPYLPENARQEVTEFFDAEDWQLQAAPNPFTSQTNVRFTVQESGSAVLNLYNLQGQKVKSVFEGEVPVGETTQVPLYSNTLSSGLYLLRLVNGSQVQYLKVVVSK